MRRRSRERLAWILAAAFATTAVAGLVWGLKLRQALREAERPLRADLAPPPDIRLTSVQAGAVALSPDGQRLALVIVRDPQTDLAVRDLVSGETKRLDGTDDATFPFWSPDSRWLGFFAQGHLKKVEATGGPVQVLCDAHAGRGGAWSPEGTIVFAPDITGPLVRVSAGGGTPTPVTRTSEPNTTHRNPSFLPDGRHFVFTTRDVTALVGGVAVSSLDGGEPKRLLERGSNPQYAGGFLLTVVGGNLVLQPFDASRQVLEQQPVPVADAIEFWNPRDLANFSVSQAGLLAYRQLHLRRTQLVWLDRAGKELSKVGEPSYYAALSFLSRGRALSVVRSDSAGNGADIWVLDLERSQMTRSTFLSAPGYMFGALSPDGTQLAVSTAGVGGRGGATLWVQPTSGSGSPKPLQKDGAFSVGQWSADGSFLIGATQEAETGFDVAYVKLDDPSRAVHFTTSRFDESAPALSADGRWIVYQSNETGKAEIFLSDFPKGARKWQVSRSGGDTPTWSSDGRELYFHGPEGAMVVAVTERSGVLELGKPEPLPFSPQIFRLDFGVLSPDGKRFLVERYDSEAVSEPVRLVRSWQRLVEK